MNALDTPLAEAERTATRLVVYRRDESEALYRTSPARDVEIVDAEG